MEGGKLAELAAALPSDVRDRCQEALTALVQGRPPASEAGSEVPGRQERRSSFQRFYYNGRVYNSLEEMPPEAREQLARLRPDHQAWDAPGDT
jgi:hypothetical protein